MAKVRTSSELIQACCGAFPASRRSAFRNVFQAGDQQLVLRFLSKVGTGEHEEEQRLLRSERVDSVGPRLSVAESL